MSAAPLDWYRNHGNITEQEYMGGCLFEDDALVNDGVRRRTLEDRSGTRSVGGSYDLNACVRDRYRRLAEELGADANQLLRRVVVEGRWVNEVAGEMKIGNRSAMDMLRLGLRRCAVFYGLTIAA